MNRTDTRIWDFLPTGDPGIGAVHLISSFPQIDPNDQPGTQADKQNQNSSRQIHPTRGLLILVARVTSQEHKTSS